MYFVSAFLFFLAIYFGISGFRSGDKDLQIFALGFFIAGIGTIIITFLAFSAV